MDIINNKIKRLIPIKVSYVEQDNFWKFEPSEESMKKINFKADSIKMRRLLRRIRAKDSLTYPNSKKGTTYQTMMDDVLSKGESTIYVWKSHYPLSLEVLEALMEE